MTGGKVRRPFDFGVAHALSRTSFRSFYRGLEGGEMSAKVSRE